MTTFTVLSGLHTIGGTQVLVEHGEARVVFDLGLAFEPAGNPFKYVARRDSHYLADMIRLGLTPDIPGLYDPMWLDERPARSAGPTAAFLSHAHLDHSHLAGFVDSRVPIYATPATARIVGVFSELGRLSTPLVRPIRELSPGESISVGEMRVTLVPVEHDVCGAAGLIVETPSGALAYSGDLRLHGSDPMRTLAFAQEARRAQVRALILEGTRLWPPPDPSEPSRPIAVERVEADVAPQIARALAAAPERLGVILISPENGDRIEEVAQAMYDMGRLFVMDLEGLTLAHAALGRPISAPHALYVPGKMGGLPSDDRALPPSLSAALTAAPRIVTADEIAVSPGAYLLRLGFEHFADLLDLLPDAGRALILTSNGSPLGPFDPAWAHLEWWAAHLGAEIVDASCTGHAAPRDLALIAAQTGASTVVSVHSRFPELMPVPPERLLLPERGRAYDLAELA